MTGTFIGAVALAMIGSPSGAVTLNNGSGDGTVTVGVDGFGSFGSSVFGTGTSDAVFDPVGSETAAGTTFESAIAVGFGGTRPYVSTGFSDEFSEGPPSIATNLVLGASSGTSLQSTFSVNALDFSLSQTLAESFGAGGAIVGSILNQVYTITNTANVSTSFDIVRYIDGDLDFDGSISDGGGRIEQSGNEILFETDASSGNDVSTTFVGITGIGGTAPATNRFEISPFSDLRDNIAAGGPLGDFIQNDNDNDGFIDNAFDVTLALRNEFTLAPGQTTSYTTQTLFGNAVPPAPGSLEALPLLPQEVGENGAFIFNVNPEDIVEGQTIFFDPVIAIGYTYEVTGAEFDSVTAPSFAAVPDPDGYLLSFSFDGTDFDVAIAAGETINFGDFDVNGVLVDGLTTFTITGIDESLLLDPLNSTAFVTGIAFEGFSTSVITLAQTPITTDTDTTAVPEPEMVWLLAMGLIGLGVCRRRRSAA